MKWTKQLENLFRHKRGFVNDDVRNEANENQNQPEALPINFNLRMLIITDTHGCLREDEIPLDHSADVCFLLGDMSLHDIAIVQEHIDTIPIYGVLGNHDGFDLYDRCGIENIHGKVIEINGVRIAGMQGSLRYKDTNFPFYTDEESIEIANSIEPADILISHDYPKYLYGSDDWAHSGLQGITHYCEKHSVPLNIHGHFHDNRMSVLTNGTTSMCRYGVHIIDTNRV